MLLPSVVGPTAKALPVANAPGATPPLPMFSAQDWAETKEHLGMLAGNFMAAVEAENTAGLKAAAKALHAAMAGAELLGVPPGGGQSAVVTHLCARADARQLQGRARQQGPHGGARGAAWG